MTERTGPRPPIHRRFNEADSLAQISRRYRHFRQYFTEQISLCQSSETFRSLIQKRFYLNGYKDWLVLSVMYNLRMNWEGRRLGIEMGPQFAANVEMLTEIVHRTTEPVQRFLDAGHEMEIAHTVFDATCLRSYGFEFRRHDFHPDAVRAFLRDRMRHYELDMQHTQLFGEPPGELPMVD